MSSSSSSSPPPPPKSTSRKRARISDEEPHVLSKSTVISDHEKSQSWWSAREQAEVKAGLKQQCRSHREQRRYSACLSEAYEAACGLAGQEENGGGNRSGTTSIPPIPGDGLRRWVQDHGPRGLESYSSKMHALRRQRHLHEAKHAVFVEQARQHFSNQKDEELLARQAESASRRAKAFASLLGAADAWAADETHQATGSNNCSLDDKRKRHDQPGNGLDP